MQTLNWADGFASYDGLEPLAPVPAPAPDVLRIAGGALTPLAAAAGGVVAAALITLTGAPGLLAAALGGTAALLYLGTALLARRHASRLIDLLAAVTAVGIAVAAPAAAISALLVHTLWGTLRGAWPEESPGRHFAMAWAAFHATAALLLGLAS
jgi:hypothetical protein